MTMQPFFSGYASHGLGGGDSPAVQLVNTQSALMESVPCCLKARLCGVQVDITNGNIPSKVILVLRGGINDVKVLVLDLQNLPLGSVTQLLTAIFRKPDVIKVFFGLPLIMCALKEALGYPKAFGDQNELVSGVDLKHAYATTPELHVDCMCSMRAVTLSAFVTEHLKFHLDMDAISSAGLYVGLSDREVTALEELGTCMLRLFDCYVQYSQLKQQQSLHMPVNPPSSLNLQLRPPPLTMQMKPPGWGSQRMFLDGLEEESGFWPGDLPSLLSSKARAASLPATIPLPLSDFIIPAVRYPAAPAERHPGPMTKPQVPNRPTTLPRQALVPRQEEQGAQQANRGARRRGRRVCLDLSSNPTSGPQEMDTRRVAV